MKMFPKRIENQFRAKLRLLEPARISELHDARDRIVLLIFFDGIAALQSKFFMAGINLCYHGQERSARAERV